MVKAKPKNKVVLVDKTCQADELDIQINEINNEPCTSNEFENLTKEQLIVRLKFAQKLVKRQDKVLIKTEEERLKQRDIIRQLWHKIKLLLIEHRENYSIFKQHVADTVTIFANGTKLLTEKVDEAKQELEEDRKQMRNIVASNEVATVKSKAAVKTAKKEFEEMLKQIEKLQIRVDKVDKERLFIKQQYDELVDKRNHQIITQEALCPKCKANKQCLDELLVQFKNQKTERKKYEEEAKMFQQLHNDLEVRIKELEKLYKRVAHERDMYKEHMKKSKKDKAHSLMSTSPLISVDSPIINDKNENDLTPKDVILNSTPKDTSLNSINSSPSKVSNSPIIKKETSKQKADLEDGEVISPNNEQEQNKPEKPKSNKKNKKQNESKKSPIKPPAKRPNEKPAPSSSKKKKKQKKMDYIYVVDKNPPPMVMQNQVPQEGSPYSSSSSQDLSQRMNQSWRTDSQKRLQPSPSQLYCDARRPQGYSPIYNSPRINNSPIKRPSMHQPNQSYVDQYYNRSPTYQLSPRGYDNYTQHMQQQQNWYRQPAPAPYAINGGGPTLPWHDRQKSQQQQQPPSQNDSWVGWRR